LGKIQKSSQNVRTSNFQVTGSVPATKKAGNPLVVFQYVIYSNRDKFMQVYACLKGETMSRQSKERGYTTVRVDYELHQRLRFHSVAANVGIQEAVEEALKRYLEDVSEANAA
jgi:fructose-1,6-bisphosphatase